MEDVIHWTCRIHSITQLESTLDKFPLAKQLGLNVGLESVDLHRDDVVTMPQLPAIVKKKCPLVERLRIYYRPNCTLWDFVEFVDGIFRMDPLDVCEFVWRGDTPGVLGFMGNFYSAIDEKGRAIEKLLRWRGTMKGKKIVTLEGVNCVCRDTRVACPNPRACATLNEFFEMCRSQEIPVLRI